MAQRLTPLAGVRRASASTLARVVASSDFDRRARVAAIGLGVAVALAGWVRIIRAPVGDFPRHWLFGARFAAGEFLYANGLDVPYPPLWAMAHAPLTLVSPHVAQILTYPVGILALGCLTWVLNRLTSTDLPLPPKKVFWVDTATVAITSHFVTRDLIECGPNLVLVTATWVALFCWRRKRVWTAGTLIGAAIALKITAAVFVPYFLLRRQWRLALACSVFAAAFTLMPAVWQGPSWYVAHMDWWTKNVARGVVPQDPRYGVLGLEKYTNISLRAALARYLTHIPASPEDQGRYVHPLNVDILTLSPGTASWVVNASIVCLIALAIWAMSGKVGGPADPRMLCEAAAVGILALLVSPITWKQHLVGMIPACYLIIRLGVVRRGLPRVAWVAFALVVISSLVLSRELAGVEVAALVHAYHLYTWSLLAVLIALWRCSPSAVSPTVQPPGRT